MNKALLVVSAVAIFLLLGMTYFVTRSIDEQRISELKSELAEVRATRDSIQTVVAYKDSVQSLIRQQVRQMEQEAERLRGTVTRLEQERQQQELEVRRLNSFNAQEKKFLETFPQLGESARVVTETRNGFEFTYIRIPLAATETFIIDHQDAQNYRAQRDTLLAVDSLQSQVGVLKDSLTTLAEQKADAYKTGYDEAFARYESCNREYVQLLKQPPQVSLFPDKRTALISGTAGTVLGIFVGAAASGVSND